MGKKEQNLVGKMVQLGVVSWGIECGQDNPGVYTKVSMFKDWMNEIMGENSGEGVEKSFQLIDSKGKVKQVRGKSRARKGDRFLAAKKPTKYCIVKKNQRKKGNWILLRKNTKCKINL